MRQGTKTARLAELIARDGGADLRELVAATGWRPETVALRLHDLRRVHLRGRAIDFSVVTGRFTLGAPK